MFQPLWKSRAGAFAVISFLLFGFLSLTTVWLSHQSNVVFAQSGGFVAEEALQDAAGGGMATYGIAEQTAGSVSEDLQAVTNWNSYISGRSVWSLSSSDLSRLSTANWNARQAGAPVITAQQLANAATTLINATLATMSASQQQTIFQQNTTISVPYGSYTFSQPGASYVSATENSNGTWSVTVSSGAFSDEKTFLQTNAPGMVSSSANFYPEEAILVVYCLATGDQGFDDTYLNATASVLGPSLGVNMSGQALFGTNGYLVRRPLSTFLTEPNISQFFTNLGF